MAQTTTPMTPGVPAPTTTVWPPSNPSGTVIPFPLPWGATGCCPPGGMDALMQCYCDIQKASAFISAIMIDQINNNPAVTEAIIAAIEKSGSSLPLVGVTNGVPAQPGQVGEFIDIPLDVPLATGNNTPTVTMGTLAPGDWDVWAALYIAIGFNTAEFFMPSVPPGYSNNPSAYLVSGAGQVSDYTVLLSQHVRAITSVPTLIAFTLGVNVSGSGVCQMVFNARRRR